MNPLEYARKNVYLWQSSPVSGQWDDARYPFVRKPLMAVADIFCKVNVVLGPSQSFKTVLNELATAWILDVLGASVLSVAQSDDDAKEFALMKLMPFLDRIKTLTMRLKDNRSAKTINARIFPTHELIVSGPGENAQNSKSVPRLITDEAHLWNIRYPGALSALQGRMGERWDRQELHTTTAPDAGAEIDLLHASGNMGEWHQRCIHCNALFNPLWTEESRRTYNGHEVFRWIQSQSINETLNSIHVVCPHCDKPIEDNPRNRMEMDEGADYIDQNPNANIATRSWRWNAFAPRWKAYREFLEKYLKAIESAKLGNLKPYEDWVKKQEVRSWTGEYPMLGDSTRGRNYCLGQIEVCANDLRVCSADQQESGGFHLWVQVDQFQKSGDSKRLFYGKVATYEDMRAIQERYGVANITRDGREYVTTAIDCGQGIRQREIFGACERFKWLALKSGDEEEFAHIIQAASKRTETIYLPYSQTRMESAIVGTDVKNVRHRGGLPAGFCISRLWSKPILYGLLYALKNGDAGREYGIATDMPQEYISQLHSYIPQDDMNRATGTVRKVIWKKVAKDDHAFITSAQNLLLAIIAGYYPLSVTKQNTEYATK